MNATIVNVEQAKAWDGDEGDAAANADPRAIRQTARRRAPVRVPATRPNAGQFRRACIETRGAAYLTTEPGHMAQ